MCLKHDAHDALCVMNNLEKPEEGEMTAMFKKKRVGQLNFDMSFVVFFCSSVGLLFQIYDANNKRKRSTYTHLFSKTCQFDVYFSHPSRYVFFFVHMFSVHRYDTPDNIAYHNNKW